ncbi:MAG: OmpA family protein [Crocinitomicaceae bacterium]
MQRAFYIAIITFLTFNVFSQYEGTWKGVLIPAGLTASDGTIVYLDIDGSDNSYSGKIRNEGYESDLYAVKLFEGKAKNEGLEFEERVVLSQKKSSRNKWCRYQGNLRYDSITGYLEGSYTSSDCRRVSGKIKLFRSEFEFPEETNITVSQVWFDRFLYDLREGLEAPEIRKKQRDNFVFEPIYFDYDKAEIRPEHYQYLNSMIRVVKGHTDLRVLVTGHTDSDGSDRYNDELSKRRAQAIVDYFVARGLKEDRLEFDFKGEKSPVDNNTTPEGRQRNRRVDFKFI